MNKQIEDHDVVELYRQSASETPTKDLDAKILSYAKKRSNRSDKWWPYSTGTFGSS